jgi:hypothetical protein
MYQMLDALKNPPEPFGDVIRTHFRLKAQVRASYPCALGVFLIGGSPFPRNSIRGWLKTTAVVQRATELRSQQRSSMGVGGLPLLGWELRSLRMWTT